MHESIRDVVAPYIDHPVQRNELVRVTFDTVSRLVLPVDATWVQRGKRRYEAILPKWKVYELAVRYPHRVELSMESINQ